MNDLSKPENLLERLRAIVGERGLVAESDRAAYENDWRGMYHGRAAAVVRPASTEEVSRVVELLAAARVPIVPQGGNTSLCGASVPGGSGREVVVSLSRMNRVRAIDPDNNTMTVEAGCVLASLQQVAEEHDRLFPLSLAAEGSCQIGGNLSTNAGGTGVLRYGNARELVLGLEVVLPDGRVWDGLRGLRKDNTGYDLKHLFIGAEGTLGIITAAVLKLFPRPRSQATALAALGTPGDAVRLLSLLRRHCGERVTGFELMQRVCLDLVFRHIPGNRDPLPEPHPWYVLAELSDSTAGGALDALAEEAFGAAIEEGIVRDAVIAQSKAQQREFWMLRENIPESQKVDGPSIKHDVSVPVSRVGEFIETANAALTRQYPAIRILAFGHVGDGNIHYNCSMNLSPAEARAFFDRESTAVNRMVYDTVAALNGSISAEHGLGVLKREEITHYKGALELELMRSIKRALDPHGLMNPGKVV